MEQTWQPTPALELDPNQLLIAEYNYIAQSAFQANEDRARVAVFYLSAVVGLGVAISGAQMPAATVPGVYWAFVILFLALGFSGFLTLLQLVRLRLAWFASVVAMNRIKEFYIAQASSGIIQTAFAWQTPTLPPRFKLWTISFLYALQVAILGGLMAGAAMMFVGFFYGGWWWGAATAVGALYALGQLWVYRVLLR